LVLEKQILNIEIRLSNLMKQITGNNGLVKEKTIDIKMKRSSLILKNSETNQNI
jgi:hypothetical protein